MKMSGIVVSLVFAAAMALGASTASAASGKIEAVENGGRLVTIGGTQYKVSGSRTKITVKGKEASRDDLKVGMQCEAKGKGEAKSIACK